MATITTNMPLTGQFFTELHQVRLDLPEVNFLEWLEQDIYRNQFCIKALESVRQQKQKKPTKSNLTLYGKLKNKVRCSSPVRPSTENTKTEND